MRNGCYMAVTSDGKVCGHRHRSVGGAAECGYVRRKQGIGSLTGNETPKHRATNYSFKGTIDEVMIWNRALSSIEVQKLYRSQN